MSNSRIIDYDGPILDYNKESSIDSSLTLLNNCHWGQLKLLYSELEFLTLCSEQININNCLILYIGAGSGGDARIKHLFMKNFYPNISMLLYDPSPFIITEDDNIKIKTGVDGYFTDDKVREVLKIANGRQIIYISDIRISDENMAMKEKLIYENMQEQQRWGIMMGAEMMLLKFRMFFYKENPEEIYFIKNEEINVVSDKIIYNKEDKKHKSNSNYLLYLDGQIYSQIYAGPRSTETRLFVKKIKYLNDANKYINVKEDGEKYLMKYYDNLRYEGVMNYFNINIRQKKYYIGDSKITSLFIPGLNNIYSSVSSYYIIYRYLESVGIEPSIKNIIDKYIIIFNYLNGKFKNNLIQCTIKNLPIYTSLQTKVILMFIKNNIKRINKQFNNLKKFKKISENGNLIDDFIKTFEVNVKVYNIINGKMTIKKNDEIDNEKVIKEFASYINIMKIKKQKKLY